MGIISRVEVSDRFGRSGRRRRCRAGLAFGALAGAAALLGGAVAGPASADGTATIVVTGPTTVAPGGLLTAEGACPASTVAHVTASHAGGETFDFSRSVVVQADGAGAWNFAYEDIVPQAAPTGDYRLGVLCLDHDAVVGIGETAFTVEGDPVTPPWAYELGIVGGSEVRAGELLVFEGVCWSEDGGGSTEVDITVDRIVPDGSSGIEAFSFAPVTIPITSADGSFSGEISIPADAPAPGRYALRSDCLQAGDPVGDAVAFFDLLVAEDPSATTTTEAAPGPSAAPPAAEAIRAQPSYTG